MDADWNTFCQAIYKGIEGSQWAELYHHYREMCEAAGAKKPSESQQAKALWAMKAAKDREDGFYDSARRENILGRKRTRLVLWEEHPLDKALKCVENQHQGWLLARDLCEIVVSMTCGREGSGMVPELWSKPFVGNGLAVFGHGHSFHAWERPRPSRLMAQSAPALLSRGHAPQIGGVIDHDDTPADLDFAFRKRSRRTTRLWLACESAGDSTGRAHSPTACCCFETGMFFWKNNDVTVWGGGLFDPALLTT